MQFVFSRWLAAVLLLLACSYRLAAQKGLEWQEGYTVTMEDFRGTPPGKATGGYQRYYLACNMEFSYTMSQYEFMFAKNFNKYVTVKLYPESSWLEPGSQTQQLLGLAQLDYLFTELYARKFRKKLYDEKGAFSNTDFFQPAYQEIQAEFTRERAAMQADIGTSPEKQEVYRQKVHQELAALADFCKTCRPKKKK